MFMLAYAVICCLVTQFFVIMTLPDDQDYDVDHEIVQKIYCGWH